MSHAEILIKYEKFITYFTKLNIVSYLLFFLYILFLKFKVNFNTYFQN